MAAKLNGFHCELETNGGFGFTVNFACHGFLSSSSMTHLGTVSFYPKLLAIFGPKMCMYLRDFTATYKLPWQIEGNENERNSVLKM